MSVIVKGMEMPDGCESCYLVESTISGISKCRVARRIWDPDPGQPLRPYWCPLRPLPEKHGRLIDGDALRGKMYHDAFETDSKMQRWDSGCWIRYKMFENNIDDAETIVEAEGD